MKICLMLLIVLCSLTISPVYSYMSRGTVIDRLKDCQEKSYKRYARANWSLLSTFFTFGLSSKKERKMAKIYFNEEFKKELAETISFLEDIENAYRTKGQPSIESLEIINKSIYREENMEVTINRIHSFNTTYAYNGLCYFNPYSFYKNKENYFRNIEKTITEINHFIAINFPIKPKQENN